MDPPWYENFPLTVTLTASIYGSFNNLKAFIFIIFIFLREKQLEVILYIL